MCWKGNKYNLTAGILIISSLIILTILDQTIYAQLGFKIAALMQFVGISLAVYNMIATKWRYYKSRKQAKK
ncbi:MAG: hypothetical protein RR494_04130 [Vagococcus sp.]|uniref:hypothetical protein n=1 Tax=Vagococcus TaxID=2737 RepID=UPI002FC8E30C